MRTSTRGGGSGGRAHGGDARAALRRPGISASAIVADRGSATRAGSIRVWHSCDRHHDVSILIGLGGRVRGIEPRSKISIMIMRPPQHGHGIGESDVVCETDKLDRYKRHLAHCTVEGEDLAVWLAASGWGVPFRDCKCEAVREASARAQAAERGIWIGPFVLPWEWRQAN